MNPAPRVKQTFRAMAHGWLACNAVFLAGALAWLAPQGERKMMEALGLSLLSLLFSVPAVLAAWLLVVLPVDSYLSRSSPWRRRERAWMLGAGAGFTVMAVPVCVITRWEAEAVPVLAFSLLAAVCGARSAHCLAGVSPPTQAAGPPDQTNTLSVMNMNTLTLFYDARCGLCSQVRRWLETQPAYLRLEFIPYDSPEAARRLPAIRQLRADEEILVLADTGELWQGAGAWVICLWALKEYRAWSARLANPAMQAMARKLVYWISAHRIGLSRLLHFRSDAELVAVVERDTPSGRPLCEVPLPPRARPVARHDLDLID